MKIPLSVREIYSNVIGDYERLQKEVDERISAFRHRDWFYSSRIKSLESYAQKVETGRFNPSRMEDFFGCSLVVPNAKSITEAETVITDIFKLKFRRPEKDNETRKRPEEFSFDDLRLYVTVKDDPALPPTGLTDLLFEVQIKTFLQHAWSIATHDLVYKTDSVSWAKSRIAFQIKAMLEHAEVSIQEAEILAKTPELSKANRQTNDLLKIVRILKLLWIREELPHDLLRLADTINSLAYQLRISITDLFRAVIEDTREGRGIRLVNLSPYGIIIQSLFFQKPDLMKDFVFGKYNKYFKVFVPKEVELPDGINVNDFVNAVRTE